MRRIGVALLLVVVAGCMQSGQQKKGGGGATTAPASRPVVARWTPKEYPKEEVNLIVMGDWGSNQKEQKAVAPKLGDYVQKTAKQFYGALLAGDNFYVKLSGIEDYQWQSLFEDMYDAKKMPMPFYATLGNHDYEQIKYKIEMEYAAAHPESRWKMPGRWYRIDMPAERPLVSVLMLDSNKPKLTKEEWEAEKRFIDEELGKRNGAVWMLACAHHPLFSNGTHGDNGVLQVEWGAIFKKHKLDFYLCGHDHDIQHLEVKGWPISFVISGGGGRTVTEMRRDVRGPFSRKMLGFAHLQFGGEKAVVKMVGADGRIVHEFERSAGGAVKVVSTTGTDKATTKPLKSIQGFQEADRVGTQGK